MNVMHGYQHLHTLSGSLFPFLLILCDVNPMKCVCRICAKHTLTCTKKYYEFATRICNIILEYSNIQSKSNRYIVDFRPLFIRRPYTIYLSYNVYQPDFHMKHALFASYSCIFSFFEIFCYCGMVTCTRISFHIYTKVNFTVTDLKLKESL